MIRFNNFRLTKVSMDVYNIPEHSLEAFDVSLDKIIKASGITHQILAKAMKVSNTTIHNYVYGYRRDPKKDFMIRIADFFDIKPSYFREYRINLLIEKFEIFPEIIDIFLDLSVNPGRIKKVIKEYEERNRFSNLKI